MSICRLFFLLLLILFGNGEDYLIGVLYSKDDPVLADVPLAVTLAIERMNSIPNFLPSGSQLISEEYVTDTTQEATSAVVYFARKGAVGIVGPSYSFLSKVASIWATVFQIPLVAYASTISDFSNKQIYPYFFRSIPKDEFEALPLLLLCEKYHFDRIGIIAATEVFELSVTEAFTRRSQNSRVTVDTTAFFQRVDPSSIEPNLLVIRDSGVRVIFVAALSDLLRQVMTIATGLDLIGKPYVYLGGDPMASKLYLEADGSVNETLKEALKGAIAVIPRLTALLNNQTSEDQEDQIELFSSDLRKRLGREPPQGTFVTYAYDAAFSIGTTISTILGGIDFTKDKDDIPSVNSTFIVASNNTDPFHDEFDSVQNCQRDKAPNPPNLRGPIIRKVMRQIQFQGLTGDYNYDDNQDRQQVVISVFNFVYDDDNKQNKRKNNTKGTRGHLKGSGKSEKSSRSGGGSSAELQSEDSELVEIGVFTTTDGLQVFTPPHWYTGSTSVPDTEPHKKVNYFDCSEGEEDDDTRGLIEYDDLNDDPRYIDTGSVCDAVVDCSNWSDEDWSCSPSILVAYIIMGTLSIILAASVVVSVVLVNTRLRRYGRIRASGLVFLDLLSLSTFCGVLSVLFLMGRQHQWVCILFHWVVILSSSVLTGSLTAKQYRIWKLFMNTNMSRSLVTNKHLILMVIGVTIPDLILLIIFSALFQLESRDDGNELRCNSQYNIIFYIIFVIYKAILLGISSIFSFITRNVPSAFSEAKIIGLSIYNSVLVGVVFLPIMFSLPEQPFLLYIISALFLMIFFYSPFLFLQQSKLYGHYVEDRQKSEMQKLDLPLPEVTAH